MGSNKRYARSSDRTVGERADEAATRGVQPTTRKNVGLELDTYPSTKSPRPPVVRGWARYSGGTIRVDAEAAVA